MSAEANRSICHHRVGVGVGNYDGGERGRKLGCHEGFIADVRILVTLEIDCLGAKYGCGWKHVKSKLLHRAEGL